MLLWPNQKQKSRLSQFEQYFLTYDNGFYHLPYSSKSPEELIESFAKYPFVKHDKGQQSIYTGTPFSEGVFCYQKLEEGCWILNSKIKYKENVAYDLVYDKPNEKLPKDKGYYILSLNDVTNKVKVDKKFTTPMYVSHITAGLSLNRRCSITTWILKGRITDI